MMTRTKRKRIDQDSRTLSALGVVANVYCGKAVVKMAKAHKMAEDMFNMTSTEHRYMGCILTCLSGLPANTDCVTISYRLLRKKFQLGSRAHQVRVNWELLGRILSWRGYRSVVTTQDTLVILVDNKQTNEEVMQMVKEVNWKFIPTEHEFVPYKERRIITDSIDTDSEWSNSDSD